MATRDLKTVTIRPAVAEDAEAVARIFNHYVANTIATFEYDFVVASEIARRIREVHAASLPWPVAEQCGVIVGYTYATRWRPRPAYRYSVEVTAYVAPDEEGRGLGSMLYTSLLEALRDRELHVAVAGIALPNDASVALHEKFGFEKVANFSQVGFKFDRWIDVGYWQRIL